MLAITKCRFLIEPLPFCRSNGSVGEWLRRFASDLIRRAGAIAIQKKFHDYAERTAQGYLWEGTLTFANVSGTFAPDQYDIVDVRTFREVRRVILYPKAISKRSSPPMSAGTCYQVV